MGKISAEVFSRAGDKYLGRSYQEMDCQKFVERAMADAGLKMDLPGSNAWYRKMTWTGSPEECKTVFGSIPKGALLFIHAFDGGEEARGYHDGKGNASHIGIYTGRGKGAIHSSQSKGGVLESEFRGKTIPNGGWNKVGLFDRFTYGSAIDEKLATLSGGGSIPADIPTGTGGDTGGAGDMSGGEQIQLGMVRTADGNPAKMRKTPRTSEKLWWKIPVGNTIEVDQTGIVRDGHEWIHGTATDEEHHVVSGYMWSEFAALDPATNAEAPADRLPWDEPGEEPAEETSGGGEIVTITIRLPREKAMTALEIFEKMGWQLTQAIGKG